MPASAIPATVLARPNAIRGESNQIAVDPANRISAAVRKAGEVSAFIPGTCNLANMDGLCFADVCTTEEAITRLEQGSASKVAA